LVEDSASGRYLDGYLIYHQRGTLFAAAVPLLEDVAYNTTGGRNSAGDYAGDFDVSPPGTLVFRKGTGPATHMILGLDTSGRTEPVLAAPDAYLLPRISPDGARVAVSIERDRLVNLWVSDLARAAMKRITFESESQTYPVWSPDGAFSRVFFGRKTSLGDAGRLPRSQGDPRRDPRSG